MLYGLLRPQDVTSTRDYPNNFPRRSQISWEEDRFVYWLKRSKTDQNEEGVDIPVFANASDTCPWHLLLRHWLLAPNKAPDAPLFQVNQAGSHFTYSQLQTATKTMAHRAGAMEKSLWFSPHSFRIGGATSLAMASTPDSSIKIAGRWSSLSYQLYTRPSDSVFKTISSSIASIPSPPHLQTFGPDGYGGTDPSTLLDADFEDIHMIINSRRPRKCA